MSEHEFEIEDGDPYIVRPARLTDPTLILDITSEHLSGWTIAASDIRHDREPFDLAAINAERLRVLNARLFREMCNAITGMPPFYECPQLALPPGESAARRALPWGDSAYTSMVIQRWLPDMPAPEPGGIWCMGPPTNGLTPSSEGERRREQAEFRQGIVGGRDYVASCLRTAAIQDGDPLFYPDDYTIGDRFTPSDLDPDLWTNPVTARPYGVAGPALREGDPVGWVDEAGELHTDTWPARDPVPAAAERIRAALDFAHAMGVEPYHYPREDQPVTIVEFIEQRLTEDQARAEAASPSPWDFYDRGHTAYIIGEDGQTVAEWDQHYLPGGRGWLSDHPNVRHIRAEEPAATLRRCAGVRRAVDATLDSISNLDGEMGDGCRPEEIRAGACTYPHNHPDQSPVLRGLASFWSTHPDYRQDWSA